MRAVQILWAWFVLATAMAALTRQELHQLQVKNNNKVISVTSDNYQQLLTGEKDYHIVLLLSSDSPQINCVLCKEIRPAFELVGDSHIKDHPSDSSVFFLKAEFMESKELFRILLLNNIPKIYIYPPSTTSVQEFTEYAFMQGSHSQLLASYLASETGDVFNIYIPTDYFQIAKIGVTTFIIAILIAKFHKKILSFTKSRILWAGISILSVLLLTTGYMFNQIRNTPYINENSSGKISYFLPGQQQQLGVETNIVSFVYGFLSLLVIVLIKKAPELKNNSVNLFAVALVSVLILVFYSALLCIFGLKGMGYPYKLIRFF